jgi:DNA-binding NarL/FixJ family response regulator
MRDIGVLTVHHDDAARSSARSVVNAAPGFQGIGEAASAEEAIELTVALAPQLALVAAGLPGIDGFETSRRLIAACSRTTVVLLYASVEPKPTTLAGSGAVAALHIQALTGDWLQGLWETYGTR